MPLDGWNTSVPDWEDRLREGKSIFPDLPLFEASASKALAVFSRIHVPDMPGIPTFGDVAEPWQIDLVRALFGSVDPDDQKMRRFIREFFVLIPKKNGKTPTAAVIMLVALILNPRPWAEFYLISSSHQIAGYSYRAIKGMIAADKRLDAIFQVQDHVKKITHRETKATLAVVSADGDIVTGSKASGILIDEMHVLGAKPRANHIMAELRGGFAARPEGFLLTITTQSKEPPQGQFKKDLERARRVRDGEESAPLLAVLYEFPKDIATSKDAWKDPKLWGLVNPNLGASVSAEFLLEEFRKAEIDGPAALAIFASLHLNIEIGQGHKLDGWIGTEFWAAAEMTGLTFDDLIARSEVAVIGIDGGGLDDLGALAVIGRDAETKRWLHWGHAWAHSEVFERRKEIAPLLHDFAEDGDLTIVTADDPTQDVREMADIAERLFEAGLLPEKHAVGLDPMGVSAIVDEMAARGIGDDMVVAVGQGFRLSPAIWGTERKLKDGTLLHCGQPLMAWTASNAKTEQRGNAVLVTKEAAGRAKIDPLVALFDAFILMTRNPFASAMKSSPWDDPDFRLEVAV